MSTTANKTPPYPTTKSPLERSIAGLSEHFVQFYETDEYLVHTLAAFIHDGMDAGDACIVIATKAHRERLEAELEVSGVDVASRSRADYSALDAARTLSKVLEDGWPSRERFSAVIEQAIVRAARGGRRVRIFGEMVALLWMEGQRAAAIRLEELWNELDHLELPYALLCAYPMHAFAGDEQRESFAEVCDQHARVVPDESYAALTGPVERLRSIAQLQQKASSLQDEIAERKAAEERLRLSEIRYRRLFEASRDGIVLVDPHSGTITDANPAAVELLGTTQDKLVGRPLWQAGLFADREAAERVMREAHEEHEVFSEPVALPTRDGQLRYLDHSSSRYRVNGHEVIQCTLRDVTERHRLAQEAARRASELVTIIEAITDGVLVFGVDGRLLQMNAAAQMLLGLRREPAYYARPLEERELESEFTDEKGEHLPGDQWPYARILRGEVLTGANAVHLWYRMPGQEPVELNVSGAPLRDETGEITGAVCVLRDVTEQRRQEKLTQEALDALLEMAHTLVSPAAGNGPNGAAPGGPGSEDETLWHLTTLCCRVLGCEHVAIIAAEPETGQLARSAITGATPEQVRHWRRGVSHLSLTQRFDAQTVERLRAGEAVVIELADLPPSDPARVLSRRRFLVAPMLAEGALAGYLGVNFGDEAEDYTEERTSLAQAVARLVGMVVERERLLHEREDARASELALREANRQMNAFLGIASHELRTPVTTMKANVQLSARAVRGLQTVAVPDTAAAKLQRAAELLESADRQSNRLNRLIEDLLDVTRIQAGTLQIRCELADLRAIAREVVHQLQLTWPGRSIALDVPGRTVEVDMDADRISQVIANFLTNALKYSPPDTPVAVRVTQTGKQTRLAVTDRGPGLSAEQQVHLWELFHRVEGVQQQSGSGSGLGIGLYICKTIVEEHGGTVGLDSGVGEGSTFWFTLPTGSARTRPTPAKEHGE